VRRSIEVDNCARGCRAYPVPELLEPYLATYLDIVRPQMLTQPTCGALRLNSRGGALAYAAIGNIFSRHSTSRLGFRVTPHDVWRKIGARTHSLARRTPSLLVVHLICDAGSDVTAKSRKSM
jgi:hypothetical protein